MALMIKAQVLHARRLGSELESPWIKTKYLSFENLMLLNLRRLRTEKLDSGRQTPFP